MSAEGDLLLDMLCGQDRILLQIGGWCAFLVSLTGCEQDIDHRELYIYTEKQLEGKVVYNALQRDMFSLLCKAV